MKITDSELVSLDQFFYSVISPYLRPEAIEDCLLKASQIPADTFHRVMEHLYQLDHYQISTILALSHIRQFQKQYPGPHPQEAYLKDVHGFMQDVFLLGLNIGLTLPVMGTRLMEPLAAHSKKMKDGTRKPRTKRSFDTTEAVQTALDDLIGENRKVITVNDIINKFKKYGVSGNVSYVDENQKEVTFIGKQTPVKFSTIERILRDLKKITTV